MMEDLMYLGTAAVVFALCFLLMKVLEGKS
jgi:hypothetical protein